MGLLFVRPAVLNVHTSSRTSKNEVGHRPTLARVTAYVLTDINIATQPKCFHLTGFSFVYLLAQNLDGGCVKPQRQQPMPAPKDRNTSGPVG
jgi:hypothetical protein